MSPFLAAFIPIGAVLTIVVAVVAWEKFTAWLDYRLNWPDWIGLSLFLSPAIVGAYFMFVFLFTIKEGK